VDFFEKLKQKFFPEKVELAKIILENTLIIGNNDATQTVLFFNIIKKILQNNKNILIINGLEKEQEHINEVFTKIFKEFKNDKSIIISGKYISVQLNNLKDYYLFIIGYKKEIVSNKLIYRFLKNNKLFLHLNKIEALNNSNIDIKFFNSIYFGFYDFDKDKQKKLKEIEQLKDLLLIEENKIININENQTGEIICVNKERKINKKVRIPYYELYY